MLTVVFAGLFTHVRMYTIRFWLHAFQRYRYIDKQKHCVPDIAPRAEGHTVSPIARCPKDITQRWRTYCIANSTVSQIYHPALKSLIYVCCSIYIGSASVVDNYLPVYVCIQTDCNISGVRNTFKSFSIFVSPCNTFCWATDCFEPSYVILYRWHIKWLQLNTNHIISLNTT